MRNLKKKFQINILTIFIMSELFKTILVQDDTLDLESAPIMEPIKGGGLANWQSYGANSQTSFQISFNIQPPSISTVIDRKVQLRSTITFQYVITGVEPNLQALSMGLTDAFQAFPLNKLIQTATVKLNNTSYTLSQRDILDVLLNTYDPNELAAWNSTTPSMIDSKLYNYSDCVGTNTSPLNAYSDALYSSKALPRGAFKIYTITSTPTSLTSASTATSWTILITATFCEPLFVSPFLLTEATGEQGFIGLRNIDINLVLGDCSRVFSTANDYTISSITISSITNTYLDLRQVEFQPSELGKVKSLQVLPYHQWDYQLSSTSNVSAIANGASATYTTANLQLSVLPDLIIVGVRKQQSAKSAQDADLYLPINSISIQFNNQSGLLSSLSQQQLFILSKQNGFQGS
jgi:hypothetical protein